MAQETFKKGDRLTNDRYTYRVRRAHRDGTMTVEAMFALRDGKEVPGYQGDRYRVTNAAMVKNPNFTEEPLRKYA